MKTCGLLLYSVYPKRVESVLVIVMDEISFTLKQFFSVLMFTMLRKVNRTIE